MTNLSKWFKIYFPETSFWATLIFFYSKLDDVQNVPQNPEQYNASQHKISENVNKYWESSCHL